MQEEIFLKPFDDVRIISDPLENDVRTAWNS